MIMHRTLKIDRLLAIIIYLLNREQASAAELAGKFEVSVRTIQRDMDSIGKAGIPVAATAGSGGGYRILDTYKMDRQLLSKQDFYHIYLALSGFSDSLHLKPVSDTLEKVKTILPEPFDRLFSEKRQRLYIDFSSLGGGPALKETFLLLDKAIAGCGLVEFTYTNNRLEQTTRQVEPMTLVFKWRSWYLFGFCRTRGDYRLFRLSRMRGLRLTESRFPRRREEFAACLPRLEAGMSDKLVPFVLRFKSEMRPLVEEFYAEDERSTDEEGRLVVRTRMPEDGWLYGLILSYGPFVEVLEPPHLRNTIRNAALAVAKLYD